MIRMHVQIFFLRHSNETLVFPITVLKFFSNRCVPIGPCVPTGTFTLISYTLILIVIQDNSYFNEFILYVFSQCLHLLQ